LSRLPDFEVSGLILMSLWVVSFAVHCRAEFIETFSLSLGKDLLIRENARASIVGTEPTAVSGLDRTAVSKTTCAVSQVAMRLFS
jgi:hypothetical protein